MTALKNDPLRESGEHVSGSLCRLPTASCASFEPVLLPSFRSLFRVRAGSLLQPSGRRLYGSARPADNNDTQRRNSRLSIETILTIFITVSNRFLPETCRLLHNTEVTERTSADFVQSHNLSIDNGVLNVERRN